MENPEVGASDETFFGKRKWNHDHFGSTRHHCAGLCFS
jgi:hypothetical protein